MADSAAEALRPRVPGACTDDDGSRQLADRDPFNGNDWEICVIARVDLSSCRRGSRRGLLLHEEPRRRERGVAPAGVEGKGSRDVGHDGLVGEAVLQQHAGIDDGCALLGHGALPTGPDSRAERR